MKTVLPSYRAIYASLLTKASSMGMLLLSIILFLILLHNLLDVECYSSTTKMRGVIVIYRH
jgi:hypothetical protein